MLAINKELGITNCGESEHIYKAVLQSVIDEVSEKIVLMEKSINEKDFKTYTILAHGLKSVALSIGAENLSGLAKEHEMKGREGDFTYLTENAGNLIDNYRNLAEKIKAQLE